MIAAGSRNLMSQVVSSANLDAAYAHVRASRKTRHHNDLFWSLSDWPDLKQWIRIQLQSGDYHLSPVKQIRLENEWFSDWYPEDAIVLKALELVLTPLFCDHYDFSDVSHIKGHGGLKRGVRDAFDYSQNFTRVIKSDIASYYDSMDHKILHQYLCETILDTRVQDILWQVLDRIHVYQGNHRQVKDKGISRGCSLSPLFGAIYLNTLDTWSKQNHVAYVRYMDDFVIFVKGRRAIRRLIKELYSLLKKLGLQLADQKTFIGRTATGFNFLGYRICPNGITIAQSTLDKMVTRYHRRYAKGASQSALTAYLKRWVQWATSGVSLNVEKLILTQQSMLTNSCNVAVLMTKY